jgi:hypothetical protein
MIKKVPGCSRAPQKIISTCPASLEVPRFTALTPSWCPWCVADGATFYRQVEALSVTPYTRRALDRGTAAAFVAVVRNAEDAYSRDEDAQDVPLDGSVRQVTERFLDRAGRAAGQRGREYLAERIGALRDRWELAKTGSGSARLGYRDRPGTDPLCAERLPKAPADFLHGAACHACLFVSETTCERGNQFLDRRFIVPVDDLALVLVPDIG